MQTSRTAGACEQHYKGLAEKGFLDVEKKSKKAVSRAPSVRPASKRASSSLSSLSSLPYSASTSFDNARLASSSSRDSTYSPPPPRKSFAKPTKHHISPPLRLCGLTATPPPFTPKPTMQKKKVVRKAPSPSLFPSPELGVAPLSAELSTKKRRRVAENGSRKREKKARWSEEERELLLGVAEETGEGSRKSAEVVATILAMLREEKEEEVVGDGDEDEDDEQESFGLLTPTTGYTFRGLLRATKHEQL